ncbi:hypothetical protein QR680_016952 [Steinernema hermaphroditum]|uniref:Uncharacterized protein n=1 Tax=Steinernema hermaphroditum TaxID=289476 RepID=A0AA39HCT6_9BILA|nr:hypothetical protein QR680_016952 [Steinernema hermaphroditum]
METLVPAATTVLVEAALTVILVAQCSKKKDKKVGINAPLATLNAGKPNNASTAAVAKGNAEAKGSTEIKSVVGGSEEKKEGAASANTGNDSKPNKERKNAGGETEKSMAAQSVKPVPDPPSTQRTQNTKSPKINHDDDTVKNIESLKREVEDSEQSYEFEAEMEESGSYEFFILIATCVLLIALVVIFIIITFLRYKREITSHKSSLPSIEMQTLINQSICSNISFASQKQGGLGYSLLEHSPASDMADGVHGAPIEQRTASTFHPVTQFSKNRKNSGYLITHAALERQHPFEIKVVDMDPSDHNSNVPKSSSSGHNISILSSASVVFGEFGEPSLTDVSAYPSCHTFNELPNDNSMEKDKARWKLESHATYV